MPKRMRGREAAARLPPKRDGRGRAAEALPERGRGFPSRRGGWGSAPPLPAAAAGDGSFIVVRVEGR